MSENSKKNPQKGDEQVVDAKAANMEEKSENQAKTTGAGSDRGSAERSAAHSADTVAAEVEATDQNGNGSQVSEGQDDQGADQSGATSELETLREELSSAQAKAEEYLDQLQRTAAEFQNSRKRQEKQLADAIERANGSLIARLLPVLDDFALAFENIENVNGAASSQAEDEQGGGEPVAKGETDRAWLDGFRQINKKLYDILHEQGLELIDAVGEFDPVRHEAISSEPSEDVESGHIIAVLRAGYEYKGRVLRPALVRVAA